MVLEPQPEELIRKHLGRVLIADAISGTYLGGIVGGILWLVLNLKFGLAPLPWLVVVATPTAITGFLFTRRHTSAGLRRMRSCKIQLDDEFLQIRGITRTGMAEVRCKVHELEFVGVGANLPKFAPPLPIVQAVNNSSRTIRDKSGASVSFIWMMAIFPSTELLIFFGEIRRRKINTNISST